MHTTTSRTAGATLLAGALLLTAGNLAHPLDAAPSATSRFALATGPSWLVVHLVVAAGFLAVTTGMVLVASRGARTVAAATTAVAAIVGGGTLALVFAGLDGYGALSLAERWNADPASRPVLEPAAVALEAIDTGLAGIGTALFMGVALLALAVVLTRERVAARWLPVAIAVVGVLGLLTGGAMLVAGPTPTTINALLRPTAMGMTLVVVALGVGLLRGSARRAIVSPADVDAVTT